MVRFRPLKRLQKMASKKRDTTYNCAIFHPTVDEHQNQEVTIFSVVSDPYKPSNWWFPLRTPKATGFIPFLTPYQFSQRFPSDSAGVCQDKVPSLSSDGEVIFQGFQAGLGRLSQVPGVWFRNWTPQHCGFPFPLKKTPKRVLSKKTSHLTQMALFIKGWTPQHCGCFLGKALEPYQKTPTKDAPKWWQRFRSQIQA